MYQYNVGIRMYTCTLILVSLIFVKIFVYLAIRMSSYYVLEIDITILAA